MSSLWYTRQFTTALAAGALVHVVITTPALAVNAPALRITPACAAPDSVVLVETNGWPRQYDNQVIHQIFLDFGSPQQVQLYPLPGENGQAPFTLA